MKGLMERKKCRNKGELLIAILSSREKISLKDIQNCIDDLQKKIEKVKESIYGKRTPKYRVTSNNSRGDFKMKSKSVEIFFKVRRKSVDFKKRSLFLENSFKNFNKFHYIVK